MRAEEICLGGLAARYDNTPTRVRRSLLVFCFTLGDHEGMDPDLPPRVSFRDFTAEAVSIRFSLPLRHSFWKRDDAQGPLDVNLLESTARREDDV